MPRLPRITAKRLIRILKLHGFIESRQAGSHLHLVHEQTGRRVTIPVHAGKVIGPGLLSSILNQAGIDPDALSD